MFRTALLIIACSAAAAQARETLTMDQPDGRTGAELNLGFVLPEGDGHARRTSIFGQFGTALDGGDRAGGYVNISMSTLDLGDDAFLGTASLSGPTGLELGGVYVIGHAPEHDLSLRVGLTLPSGGSFFGGIAGVSAALSRITDLVLAAPEVGALRLAVSPRGAVGRFIYQVDAGIDVPLFGENSDLDSLARLNLMGGLDYGAVAVMAELNNLAVLGDDLSESLVHIGSLTARFDVGGVKPGVGFSVPLDEDIDGINLIAQISLAGTLQ